jgi:hypothetical protein
VHGSKGVYELVYFLKDSRPIDRFKKMAEDGQKFQVDKTTEDVERQVFTSSLIHL